MKVLVTFLLVISFVSAPQDSSNQANNIEEQYISKDEYYQKILQKTEKQNEALLSTLYWSLSSIITILIAIIGTSIWFNYKFSNKEVDNIIKAAEQKVDDLKTDIGKKHRDDFSKLEEKLKEDIDDEFEAILDSFDNQLSAYNSANSEKFDNLKDKVENAQKLFQISLDKMDNYIDYKFKSIEHKVVKNSGRLWKLEGVKGNALSSFLRAAKQLLELGKEPRYILNDIIDTLKEMNSISKRDYKSAKELLKELGSSYKDEKEQINNLIEDLPRYDLRDFDDKTFFKNIPSISDLYDEEENS